MAPVCPLCLDNRPVTVCTGLLDNTQKYFKRTLEQALSKVTAQILKPPLKTDRVKNQSHELNDNGEINKAAEEIKFIDESNINENEKKRNIFEYKSLYPFTDGRHKTSNTDCYYTLNGF